LQHRTVAEHFLQTRNLADYVESNITSSPIITVGHPAQLADAAHPSTPI
jgi:hypothetical protein